MRWHVAKLAVVGIALLPGCRRDTSSSASDSVGDHVAESVAANFQNSYDAVAGDTLQLVSIGGTTLATPGESPISCDAPRTPVRQQILLAADSTYWESSIARPGCRDAANSSSGTVESRGGYRIFGDTLVLSPADMDTGSSVAALLFADSVVQVDVPPGEVMRYSRRRGSSGNPAALGRVRTDTVFITGDIDGSGKPDYVVRETRMGSNTSMKDYRLAIYLDKAPGSARPDWVNRWDDLDYGADQSADTSLTITHDATLIAVGWSGGDYSATEILIAERGRVRPEISYGIDYGHGYFAITRETGTVVVEGNLDHLELHGAPVTSEIKCVEPEMAVRRLLYDLKSGHFVPERSRCVRPM
jgi:hypothetical protein